MRTDEIIHLLVQDLPTPARKASSTLQSWLPLAALGAGGGFLAVMGVRADLAAAGFAPTVIKLGLGVLMVIGAVAGALRLSRPEGTVAPAVRWLVLTGAFLAVVVAADLARKGLDGWGVRLFGKNILACLTLIPALAAAPLAAALMSLRHGATTKPAAAGAFAGLASAGLAILAYGLFCTEDSPLFIATWYTLAAGLVGLAGAGIGRAFLRW